MANVHDGISVHGIGMDERIALRRIIFHRQKSGLANDFSMRFDGTNDFLTCGDVTILDGLTTLTVSFWMNIDTFPSSGATGKDVFRKGANLFTGGFGIALAGDQGVGNGNRFIVQVPGNFRTTNHSSSPIPQNTWFHIAVTMAPAGFNLYLNGENFSTSNGTTLATDMGAGVTIANVSDNLTMGAKHDGSNAFDGFLDEVAVFNETKSQAEVRTIYNEGIPTDLTEESGLIGYWRMEEGSGSTVADSSSNSNTATLTNGAAFNSSVPS